MRSVSRQGYLKGAAILSAAVIATKAIGFFYKVPLQNLIGDENTGIFTAAYNVYSVLLAVAAAGIPVALSRLVASAAEQERPVQVRRYFLVAMPVFTFLGGLGAALMYLFSRQIAGFVGVPEAAAGIRVLAPAVLLVCVYSVYRGYLQGFGNMIPTALSQIVESVGKVAVGLTAAWLLLDRGAPGERVCAGAHHRRDRPDDPSDGPVQAAHRRRRPAVPQHRRRARRDPGDGPQASAHQLSRGAGGIRHERFRPGGHQTHLRPAAAAARHFL